MTALGEIEEEIRERVEETGNNFISRRVVTIKVQYLLICPKQPGVAEAILLAGKGGFSEGENG